MIGDQTNEKVNKNLVKPGTDLLNIVENANEKTRSEYHRQETMPDQNDEACTEETTAKPAIPALNFVKPDLL